MNPFSTDQEFSITSNPRIVSGGGTGGARNEGDSICGGKKCRRHGSFRKGFFKNTRKTQEESVD